MGSGKLSPTKVSKILRGGGVKDILKKPVYPGADSEEPEYSQAEVIADVINVMRLDNQALGDAADIEIYVSRITEERVAEMLSKSVNGDPTELVEVFNTLEEQRDRILRELMDEDDYEEFIEFKRRSITTCNPPEEDVEDRGDS
ncbi:MAG: hypothetical protein U5J64_11195 [Halobacteriales archaeon]|nr:hypothetical protein [Halobacteriales archaeon]